MPCHRFGNVAVLTCHRSDLYPSVDTCNGKADEALKMTICRISNSRFLLSVSIAGTMNPKAGTTYHAQPVADS